MKEIYTEICKAHHGIADFRAKLLALLPIASCTGIFLLLDKDITTSGNFHFIAVGIFGVLITLGLFFYELRGIQTCNSLREKGKCLENIILKECYSAGVFNNEPGAALFGIIGATGAAMVIYSTIIGAWCYVGFMGICYFSAGDWRPLTISGIITVFFMVVGWIISQQEKNKLFINDNNKSEKK